MSTPIPEQFIPEEFRDVIDLPDAGTVDEGKLAQQRAQVADYERQIAAYKDALANHKWALANRKNSPRSQQQLHDAIARMNKLISTTQGRRQDVLRAISGTTGDFGELLHGEDRDAYEALKSMFDSYGLGTLAPKIFDYVKQGYGADTIALLLQDTPEYKERFSANEARKKAGLPVLSPAEYLSVENSYRQILSSAGMPKGFYDNNADFRQWIANDVSPTEIKDRVDLATAATTQSNPAYRAALHEMYGINESDLTAYFLDRKKAEPILKKQAAAAAVGAAALRRGLNADRQQMENLATAGVTGSEAEQGFAHIAQGLSSMLGIAHRFGSSWSLNEAENATFGLGGEVKQKRLASQERALFAGGLGSSVSGLNAGFSQT